MVNTAKLDKMTRAQLIDEIRRLKGWEEAKYNVGDQLFAIAPTQISYDFDGLIHELNAYTVIPVTVEMIRFYKSKRCPHKYVCRAHNQNKEKSFLSFVDGELFTDKNEALAVADKENKQLFVNQEKEVHRSHALIMSWNRQLMYPTNVKKAELITIYVTIAESKIKDLSRSIANMLE